MKKVRNIKKLAMELDMEKVELFTRVLELNEKYELNIDNYDDLEEWQCVLIRNVLSEAYAVRLTRKDKGFAGKYNYRNSPQYVTVANEVERRNFSGKSTKEVMSYISQAVGEDIRGKQMVAFVMREEGYECKHIYIDNVQVRRWYKKGYVSPDLQNIRAAVKYFTSVNNLDGWSMDEILLRINLPITPQGLGPILREFGYEPKNTKTGDDIQSRRWYSVERTDPTIDAITNALVHLDLNGLGLDEIKDKVNVKEGVMPQHLGRILKDLGYECKITRKDGVQARRWYKADTVSFL